MFFYLYQITILKNKKMAREYKPIKGTVSKCAEDLNALEINNVTHVVSSIYNHETGDLNLLVLVKPKKDNNQKTKE